MLDNLEIYNETHVLLNKRTVVCQATALNYLADELSKFNHKDVMQIIDSVLEASQRFTENLTDDHVNQLIRQVANEGSLS